MLRSIPFLAAVAAASSCGLRKFENLVSFGDSFTDDTQLSYFAEHEDYPPPGTKHEGSNVTNSGGYAWGRLVAQKTNVNYNNYAVSGAMCTKAVNEVPVSLPGVGDDLSVPDVLTYQVPLYEADLEFEELYPNRKADNTVYTLGIGANDLAVNGFMFNQQKENATLSTISDCRMEIFDRIHASGGRYFVLISTLNIEDTPLFTPIPDGGLEWSRMWTNKSDYDTVAEHGKLETFVHALIDLSAQSVELGMLKNRWPDSTFVLFDIYTLFEDMMADPEAYFSEPADIKGVYSFCE